GAPAFFPPGCCAQTRAPSTGRPVWSFTRIRRSTPKASKLMAQRVIATNHASRNPAPARALARRRLKFDAQTELCNVICILEGPPLRDFEAVHHPQFQMGGQGLIDSGLNASRSGVEAIGHPLRAEHVSRLLDDRDRRDVRARWRRVGDDVAVAEGVVHEQTG